MLNTLTKMKKTLLQVIFLLFCLSSIQGQESSTHYNITGKIIDAKSNNALEYATITFNQKGSTEIIGSITDKKGKFELSVPKGKYTITFEFLGYKTKTLSSQNVTNDIHFGSIELSEDMEFLKDIVINGEKKIIEIKPKKTVYNVTKDISTQGSMVTDILNNIPSVNIENGMSTILGKQATILINGRTSSMSKSDALNSLPAGSVEKIEVITNPGAQYNASFQSIINIILKKGKDEGLNASVTGSIGHKDIYGGLLSLNYKTKSVNFFTNTSYAHSNKIKLSNFENEYFSSGITTSFLNEESEFNSKNNDLSSTIGADFYLSKNTTLTTSINYTNLNHKRKTLTNSSILNSGLTETSYNEREHLGDFKDEIIELSTKINHQFIKEGRTLSAYIIHINDVESYDDNILNTDANYTNDSFSQKNKLINTEFNINYSSPLTEKTSMTIGYNGDFGKIPFSNSTSSNNVDYSRDVHAVFSEFAYETDNFYFDVGLRGEFSKATIDYLDINNTQNLKLNSFFPSTYIQYIINDKKVLNFSYGKSIARPAYDQLQPFEERFSETLSYTGNPELKHHFLHSFYFDYTYSGEKITVIPALFYNRYNNLQQDVTYETGEQIDGVNKLITTPQNIGHANHYGTSITALIKASTNLDFTLSTNLYIFDQHGIFETTNILNQPIAIDYNNKGFNGIFKLLTQLKIPKAFNLQTNISHHLESEGPVSKRKAYTYASLALSRDMFDKNATLSLNINDVFNSNIINRDRFTDHFFSRINIQNKYSDIILSFTYRFNQSKKKRKIDFDKKNKKPTF